jgi:hypothetical protein
MYWACQLEVIASHTSLYTCLVVVGIASHRHRNTSFIPQAKAKRSVATDYRVLDNSCTWQYSTNTEFLQAGYWYLSAAWNCQKCRVVWCWNDLRVCLFESYFTSQVSAQEINCHPRCPSRFDILAIEHGTVSIEMVYRTLGSLKYLHMDNCRIGNMGFTYLAVQDRNMGLHV